MDKKTIRSVIIKSLKDQALESDWELSSDIISDEMNFNYDLGIDSMEFLVFICKLEDAFGIEINIEDFIDEGIQFKDITLKYVVNKISELISGA